MKKNFQESTSRLTGKIHRFRKEIKMIKTKTKETIKEYDPISGNVLRKIKTKSVTTDDTNYVSRENEYDSEELPLRDVR